MRLTSDLWDQRLMFWFHPLLPVWSLSLFCLSVWSLSLLSVCLSLLSVWSLPHICLPVCLFFVFQLIYKLSNIDNSCFVLLFWIKLELDECPILFQIPNDFYKIVFWNCQTMALWPIYSKMYKGSLLALTFINH